ncbi:MAG: tetratricopeptide repeat protein [Nanoarchaeota archaeon]
MYDSVRKFLQGGGLPGNLGEALEKKMKQFGDKGDARAIVILKSEMDNPLSRILLTYLEGIEKCDIELEADPHNLSSLGSKTLMLIDLGRYEEALRCLNTLVEFDPKEGFWWNKKGLALVLLNMSKEEAFLCFKKALEIDPSDEIASEFSLKLGKD